MLKSILAILLAVMPFVGGSVYANEECNDPSIMRGEPVDEYGTLVIDKNFTVDGRGVRVVVQYGGIAMIQCDMDALTHYVAQLAKTDIRNDDHLISSAAGEFFNKRLGPDKNASVRVYIF